MLSVHIRSTSWRDSRRSSCLRKLLSRHRHCRGRSRNPNLGHCRKFRDFCSKSLRLRCFLANDNILLKAGYETNVSAFFSEFLITAILLLVILAATDKRNTPPPYGLLPLVLFILLLGIAAALGINTGGFTLSC